MIMDLKNPLMTKEGVLNFNDITTLPLNPENRGIKNIIPINMITYDSTNELIQDHVFNSYPDCNNTKKLE